MDRQDSAFEYTRHSCLPSTQGKQEAQVETSTKTRRPFRLLGGAGKRRLLSQINRSSPKSSLRGRLPNDPNTNFNSTEAHVPTPRYGQYLTHAHNHITPVVAAMDSCFVLIRTHHREPAECVCVTDGYFIANLLDLPFASPIAIYH